MIQPALKEGVGEGWEGGGIGEREGERVFRGERHFRERESAHARGGGRERERERESLEKEREREKIERKRESARARERERERDAAEWAGVWFGMWAGKWKQYQGCIVTGPKKANASARTILPARAHDVVKSIAVIASAISRYCCEVQRRQAQGA
jgi:hypothetical protein